MISPFTIPGTTDDPPTEEEDRAFVGAAFRRLARVLVDSPHLITHIRSVSITTRPEVVTLLANMGLTHLCYLELYSDSSGAIDGPLIAPLRRLIGLESMQRVKICAAFSAQIFSACTPCLAELVFDAAEQDSCLDGATPTSGALRTIVKHPTLRNSPCTADWLVDPPRLDIAHFFALEHIYLFVPHICDIPRLLPSISDLDRVNIIRTITFNLEDGFCDHHWTEAAEAKLVRFDTDLANLPLLALVEVVVILPQLDDLGDYNRSEVILKRALPRLGMRRVLRVEVNVE
ncbi:hypothetical protein B0H17DRAFT_1201029 [Mycena rosella]|uniref:Uncharacterized protein n=1 Tax=Mycena rosella TaxID=1033263 RepID=A0AAD7GJ72_MYCRO|nr:hypothetical protein B0H17DRAFT_1201029 [Mycena rosella]